MDRNEFIERVVSRHRLSEDEARFLKQDYFAVLDNDIDFARLFQDYLEEYNFNVPPKPAWFKQRAKKKHNPNRSTDIEFRSLYVKLLPKGGKYEFSYIYPHETQEQAAQAIRERFSDREFAFITKEEFKE